MKTSKGQKKNHLNGGLCDQKAAAKSQNTGSDMPDRIGIGDMCW